MIDVDQALRESARLHPGRDVRLEGEGQFAIAVRVGDKLLLRFPRHEVAVAPLRFEVQLLERIRRLLTSVDVPEILAVELDQPIGRAHVTNRHLPGAIVNRETVAGWTEARVHHVGARVRAFLGELHSLTAEGRLASAPERTAKAFADELAADVDGLLAARMTVGQRARADRETAALADLPDRPAMLCHTDLGGNLLFDDDSGRLAVIDFADSLITHPAFDLASLSVLGDELVEGGNEALVVRATFALQDACNAARQGDWRYVDEVLAGY